MYQSSMFYHMLVGLDEAEDKRPALYALASFSLTSLVIAGLVINAVLTPTSVADWVRLAIVSIVALVVVAPATYGMVFAWRHLSHQVEAAVKAESVSHETINLPPLPDLPQAPQIKTNIIDLPSPEL